MTACWKPGCTRDAPHELAGHDWALRSCDRHLAVAQAVTGKRSMRTWREGRDALFEVGGSQ